MISVVIPSFNRAGILERAINSVLIQEFQDWELIVVDDGSTDDTKEKLLPFLSHSQISYYYQPNAGVSAARNYGAEMAKGEWLIFLDSDDELLTDCLLQFTDLIKKVKDVKLIKNGFLEINVGSGQTIIKKLKLHKYSPPIPGSFAVKRKIFQLVGGYDTELKYSENTELFIRFAKSNIYPKMIESTSLIYYGSLDGGSKNLPNMEKSISRILDLHGEFMGKKECWNLFQTLGVIQLKLSKFPEAKKSLLKSIKFKPSAIATYLRFIIACFPFLSRKIYSASSINK